MQPSKKKTTNEILTKLNELESLLKRKHHQPLNFNQAADYLGFSHSYLYKLTSRKIIPCHRPTGKILFFSKQELDEWVFGNEKLKISHGRQVKNEKLEEDENDEEEEDDEDDP